MQEIEPPAERIRSLKDFLIHIATIVLGVLIAIALEQTVEYFHHRLQVAKIRDALRLERRIDINRFAVTTDEFHRTAPHLQTNLAIFQYLRKHPGALPALWPGRFDWSALSIVYVEDAWRTAQESSILEHMPQAEVTLDAELYRRLQQLNVYIDWWRAALNDANRFAIQDPEAAHLSGAQIERQIELTSEVLLRYAVAANAQRNLSKFYPDFQPAPTRHEIECIRRVISSPDDLKDAAALIDRVESFDRTLGINTGNRASDDSIGESSRCPGR